MAIYADQHVHSSFSGDSDTPMEQLILEAIQKNLKYITFTEHKDIDFPVSEEIPDGCFDLNTDSYLYDLLRLRSKYEDQIKVLFGIELGLQPQVARKNQLYMKEHELDFVIASSHVCNGKDPYYSSFYEGRSIQDAFSEYFQSIIDNIKAFSNFDVYGHLDYIVRYAPGKSYQYHDYTDYIDEILKLLLEKEKGIEVNTGSFHDGLLNPNPCKEIIQRYHELGGEIITIGSDTHTPGTIASHFDEICILLKECGFKYYSLFENRLPEYKVL